MTEPPPRKRFQIHLSTAIVMMFVAGGFIWANTSQNKKVSTFSTVDNTNFIVISYGWPFWVVADEGESFPNWSTTIGKQESWGFSWSHCLFNLLIALDVLWQVWFLCEWLIRRAARKGG